MNAPASFRTSDGVRLVYDDLGARDDVPVVLCHGIAAAGEQLADDARFFAGRGYRVLLPDLRGHGRSDRPPKPTSESLSIARLALDLEEMLDHAGTAPVHWAGNSLGGILALHLLGARAHRFRTLATFGTAYRLDLPRWIGSLIPFGYGIIGARMTGWLTALTTTRNTAARPLIARLVRDFDPRVGGTLAANLARYDLIANATAVRLPILLLRGGRDTSLNAALGPTLAAMQERPNFELVDLPDAGHCANLDATKQWRQALLNFWARNDPDARPARA